VTSPTSGVLRLVRVSAFTATTVVLASVAHVLGSGDPPPPAVLLALCLPTGLVCAVVGRRPQRAATTWLGLGAMQVALHEALRLHEAFQPHGGGALRCSPGRAAGHTGHPAPSVAGCVDDGVASVGAGDAIAAGWPSWAMVGGHLLATGLVALVLAHGERLLERLLQALDARVPTPTAGPVPAGRPAPPWAAQTVLVPVVAAGGTCRRGPPA
jgi:hypothetical protein